MKRIIAIFTLFLAFSFNANAQEAKTFSTPNTNEKSVKEIIIEDINLMSKSVKMEEGLKMDLVNLLQMRKDDVNNSKTQEEKQAVFERYTLKLLSAFNEEQIEALKRNKELYSRLTQFSSK
ncbi:hypothetical protein [Flavobacterium sp.]|jgi:hypothetical protein|uniref:hypothetical protein n=1 Tax=Flavobacterium sp. TaxID=239 RepID=UPI0037C12B82